MKAGTLAIAAFASLAAAQPRKHAHHHEARDVVTHMEYVTATADNVVVYVDGNGNPVSTSFKNQAQATPAPQAANDGAAANNKNNNAAPADNAAPPVVGAQAEVKAQALTPAEHKAKAAKHSEKNVAVPANKANMAINNAPPAGPMNAPGIAYSPYNGDNSCKSAGQVAEDLGMLKQYPVIRLYGVDCNQIANVMAAKAPAQKLFAGVFDINSVATEIPSLISQIKGDWASVDTVSVGNELLNTHQASAGQLVTAINTARGILRTAGYQGPVVTVDTFNALIANNYADPSLCEASDYSAANAHAFYDPNTAAPQAGSFLRTTVNQIKDSCPGKRVVITETGWPSAGSPNGAAVPSEANQKAAMGSIRGEFPTGGVILFSAFNDLWKVNADWNFFAEQSYGIYGNAPSA